MPDESIVAIEPLRVLAVDGLHACGEVGLRGLEQEVVVVLHQAVAMDQPPPASRDLLDEF